MTRSTCPLSRRPRAGRWKGCGLRRSEARAVCFQHPANVTHLLSQRSLSARGAGDTPRMARREAHPTESHTTGRPLGPSPYQPVSRPHFHPNRKSQTAKTLLLQPWLSRESAGASEELSRSQLTDIPFLSPCIGVSWNSGFLRHRHSHPPARLAVRLR